MEAQSSKFKEENTFEVDAQAPQPYQLLKTAVVYGANGSGKTNFILALYALQWFVRSSASFITGHPIECYEPHELEEGMSSAPIQFDITFIGRDNVKYNYKVAYTLSEVVFEQLEFYPFNKPAVLFKRRSNDSEIHEVILGGSLVNKRISKTIFSNQLFLSRFGRIEPHEQLSKIFKYFDDIEISRGMERANVAEVSRRIARYMGRPENAEFARRLNFLILDADKMIKEVVIEEIGENSPGVPVHVNTFGTQSSLGTIAKPMARHAIFKNGKEVGYTDFDFLERESTGTNVLFALGGLIMQVLDKGGILIADEFNNGLHPKLTNFLLKLFHQRSTNPNNAQLIINTHEITLLDKEIFRSDQIWFIEKTKFGDSELYSAQDFKNVREDIPFDKWYMAGKFNAVNDFFNTHYYTNAG
jgi:AAA15 family ATPase/GTPase